MCVWNIEISSLQYVVVFVSGLDSVRGTLVCSPSKYLIITYVIQWILNITNTKLNTILHTCYFSVNFEVNNFNFYLLREEIAWKISKISESNVSEFRENLEKMFSRYNIHSCIRSRLKCLIKLWCFIHIQSVKQTNRSMMFCFKINYDSSANRCRFVATYLYSFFSFSIHLLVSCIRIDLKCSWHVHVFTFSMSSHFHVLLILAVFTRSIIIKQMTSFNDIYFI